MFEIFDEYNLADPEIESEIKLVFRIRLILKRYLITDSRWSLVTFSLHGLLSFRLPLDRSGLIVFPTIGLLRRVSFVPSFIATKALQGLSSTIEQEGRSRSSRNDLSVSAIHCADDVTT